MEREINYYLLMIANPLSCSDVAITIYKMFRRLDILSRDIIVFFPGFHHDVINKNGYHENINDKINSYLEYNQINHSDYHGRSPIFHTYCDSVGDIFFNEADFARFINELEDSTDRFEYDGSTQLVLIPSLGGEIIYKEIKTYNLESLFDYQTCSSQKVEEFLVSILRSLQKDPQRNSLDVIPKINTIYNNKLTHCSSPQSLNRITIHLDDRIVEHMQWKKSDEVIFISYSTKDEYHAFALKALIEKNKKQVWIAPDGIPEGSDYACAIPAALRISSRVVVLLSHNSANSTWVRREIGKAISNNKKIDGILLDGFTMEDINQYDHFDFLFEGIQIKYSIRDLFENKAILNAWL